MMPQYTQEDILMRCRTLLVKWVANSGSTVSYLAGVALEVALVDLITGLAGDPPQPEPDHLERPADA